MTMTVHDISGMCCDWTHLDWTGYSSPADGMKTGKTIVIIIKIFLSRHVGIFRNSFQSTVFGWIFRNDQLNSMNKV